MQRVSLCLCSLLAATSPLNVFIGQKMQLTDCDNANRELKQATFLSTRTSTGSKPRRYRWRMMASAVLVWNHERESWMTTVADFKRERLTPSLAIYNGAIYFRRTSVLTKTSPAKLSSNMCNAACTDTKNFKWVTLLFIPYAVSACAV